MVGVSLRTAVLAAALATATIGLVSAAAPPAVNGSLAGLQVFPRTNWWNLDISAAPLDASSASSLPAGWKRDFLLYTDGWIKDSDLNTAFGTTVGPLPFHSVQSYPYGRTDAYPTDPQHQRYLREFNTRVVRGSVSPP